MQRLFSSNDSPVSSKEEPFWRRAKKWAKKLLFETTAEIWIGLVIFGAIAGGLGYRHAAGKAGEIPLGFSEIETITQEFNAKGLPVPALTKDLASDNDVPMKVFESNNIALAINDSHAVFAHELETRIDASLKKHKLISEYAAEKPEDARKALQAVSKVVDATVELPAVKQAFDDAWGYHRRDVTHTRHWTTQSCSNGKCTTQYHSETVYDYSWHTYTYYPEAGARASQLLHAFMDKNPDLTINERLYVAHATHVENEEAIRQSRARELKGKTLTPAEYQKYANTWARGSNFEKYEPQVNQDYASLKATAPQWDAAQRTAHSETYRTYSRSDSGPSEYQTAERGKNLSGETVDDAHGIVDGIVFSAQKVPELNNMIKEYVDVVLHGKAGNPDKLRSDIMKTARQIYDKNFENGFDVHPFKWLEVVLWTMLGMGVGAGLGAGVNKLLDVHRRDWYENDKDEDGENPFTRASRREDPFGYHDRKETPVIVDETPEPAPAPVSAVEPVNDDIPLPQPAGEQDNKATPQDAKWKDKYGKMSI